MIMKKQSMFSDIPREPRDPVDHDSWGIWRVAKEYNPRPCPWCPSIIHDDIANQHSKEICENKMKMYGEIK